MGNIIVSAYLRKMFIAYCVFISLINCRAQGIEIKNGWYYINGDKFFIKGIGYETHTRPGQVPWVYEFDADIIKFDLNRIKEAGFNTIRTWGALSEEELQLVEQSGLKVLFGIWIDPAGDFGDETFVQSALNHVSSVLSYSKKYSCILGYLIMNEPQVNSIYNSGAENLISLWKSIIEIINAKHPGVPVSFSNSMVGDYIGMDIFNFAAYNAYIYNPVTLSKSSGYRGFLQWLKDRRSPDKPFIITEYGLSVSPGVSLTEYGYGKNTVDQQKEGDLLMYRQLIDADAQGGCVFQYHDGWWKGGNEFIHDPNPEEWFGLIGFTSEFDKTGETRPAWGGFKRYNKAIIINPKNEHIYQEKIPIEIYSSEDVFSFKIFIEDSVVFEKILDGNYFSENLSLTFEDSIKDVLLNFRFFNSNNDTLKSEVISILYTKNMIELPKLKFEILPGELLPDARNYMNIHVVKDSLFLINDNKIDYAFHPHLGFDPGQAKSKVMEFREGIWDHLDFFEIPEATKVATFSAGFTITYGQFQKRICAQKILLWEDWAEPIAASELITGVNYSNNDSVKKKSTIKLFQAYPNPFNQSTTIKYFIPSGKIIKEPASLKIYNILGQELTVIENLDILPGVHVLHFNSSELSSGMYFYSLVIGDLVLVKKFIVID